jgi:hypothetical protein
MLTPRTSNALTALTLFSCPRRTMLMRLRTFGPLLSRTPPSSVSLSPYKQAPTIDPPPCQQ